MLMLEMIRPVGNVRQSRYLNGNDYTTLAGDYGDVELSSLGFPRHPSTLPPSLILGPFPQRS
ncbi:hypothetical protein BGW80DRAFT_1301728 [Lactifluus volemus]|nr:hypothetical protein BGW80DRAFT_1301728 [Lactifluus volemus]